MVAGWIDSHGPVAGGGRPRIVARRLLRRNPSVGPGLYEWATDVLFEVRKQRSEAKQPLKVPITKVTVRAGHRNIQCMPFVEADLRSSLRVQAFETTVGEPREIIVVGYEAAAPAAQT